MPSEIGPNVTNAGTAHISNPKTHCVAKMVEVCSLPCNWPMVTTACGEQRRHHGEQVVDAGRRSGGNHIGDQRESGQRGDGGDEHDVRHEERGGREHDGQSATVERKSGGPARSGTYSHATIPLANG